MKLSEDDTSALFNMSGIIKRPAKLQLPKFEFENEIELKEILKNTGLEYLFKPGDFNGMFSRSGNMYISDVIQKSYIKV